MTTFTSAGIRALRRILIGVEATHGMLVAPTTILIGNLTLRMEQGLYLPDQLETGRMNMYERAEVIARDASLSYESDASYQQLELFLNMAISNVPVGTVWTPNYGTSDALVTALRDNFDTYTFYYGDDRLQWVSGFVSCRQLEFNGAVGDVVKLSADLFGQDAAPLANSTAVPAIIADPNYTGLIDAAAFLTNSGITNRSTQSDLESVKMNTGQLYVAPMAGDEVNFTADNLDATLVDFNYRITTGFSPMRYANGQLYFTDIAQAKRGVEMEMTVAVNSDVASWFANHYRLASGINQPRREIALQFNGSMPGNTVSKQLRLRMFGALTEYGELAEREGQDIVRIKYQSILDETEIRDMQIELINT